MKSKKIRIAVYGVAVLMAAGTALVYGKLPEQIPTSWDFNGNVEYGSRMTLWMLVGFQVMLAVMMEVMPKIDPRKQNYAKFSGYYDGFCLLMQLFMVVMWGIIVSESLYPGQVSVGKVVMVLLGILFLFLGNMLPKVKSNFYMGFRTSWALSDSEVWRKTQRLGGKTMFAGGIAMLLAGIFLEKLPVWFFLAVLILATGIPSAMSYLWWRKSGDRKS